MERAKRIVLTGGPCAGKTTAIDHLQQAMPNAYCAPEAATILITGGFPLPGQEDRIWTPDWQEALQTGIAGLQKGLEEIAVKEATQQHKDYIIYDRGLLDGMAYITSKNKKQILHEKWERLATISVRAALGRYDAVIHLQTFAETDGYNLESNQARSETAEEAKQLDALTWSAWDGHPNRIRITAQENRAQAVQEAIENL